MSAGNKTLEDLLAPISERLGHSQPPASVRKADVAALAPARCTDGLGHDELVEMFVDEAEKIRIDVHRCHEGEVADVIAAIVANAADETHSGEVVYADDPRMITLGITAALKETPQAKKLTRWDAEQGRDALVAAADAAQFGITFATGAIAETGTIVQPITPQCGRSVSLLPLVHIAVVEASTVVPTMLDAMQDLEKRSGEHGKDLPSQVCLISGPSVTSDIELVRVEGVHGPMFVHYVLVG